MSQWTVKRDEPERSPGARVGSYLFGLALLASLGGLAGAFLPLFLATTQDRRKPGETFSERARRERLADSAMDVTVNDTKAGMGSRVLIGALLGAAGAGVLAWKTESARQKKLGLG